MGATPIPLMQALRMSSCRSARGVSRQIHTSSSNRLCITKTTAQEAAASDRITRGSLDRSHVRCMGAAITTTTATTKLQIKVWLSTTITKVWTVQLRPHLWTRNMALEPAVITTRDKEQVVDLTDKELRNWRWILTTEQSDRCRARITTTRTKTEGPTITVAITTSTLCKNHRAAETILVTRLFMGQTTFISSILGTAMPITPATTWSATA